MLQKKQPKQPILASDYNVLVDLINKPKIIGDGKSIIVKNIGGTTIISSLKKAINNADSGGEIYDGYFKIIIDKNKIKVVDSLIYDSETGILTGEKAGFVILNDNEKLEVDAKEFTITGNCHLVIEIKENAELKVVSGLDFDPKKAEDLYNNEQGNPDIRAKLTQILVSRIFFEDSKIKKITQELRIIPHALIFGKAASSICDSIPGTNP
jgi:hypothetical protein